VGILLSLAAAITYGSADFLGGVVSRRVNVLVVVLVSQALGSTALALCLILFSDEPLSVRALEWGGAAGVAGTIGIVLFYRALAEGHMSIVAPVTAVEAACDIVGCWTMYQGRNVAAPTSSALPRVGPGEKWRRSRPWMRTTAAKPKTRPPRATAFTCSGP
jgi:uncharacterized membrane protein